MARYTVNITSQEDLEEVWVDSSAPNMSFTYNELSLEDCINNGDGTYTATYDTMELTETTTFTYLSNSGSDTTISLSSGEYGVKP
jgi:hypothetical protein